MLFLVVVSLLEQRTTSYQRAHDAPDQRVEKALEFGRSWRRGPMKARVLAGKGVGTIEDKNVQMDVELERKSEPLNKCDQAGLGNTRSQPCAVRERRRQCPSHHREHPGK